MRQSPFALCRVCARKKVRPFNDIVLAFLKILINMSLVLFSMESVLYICVTMWRESMYFKECRANNAMNTEKNRKRRKCAILN